VDPEKSVTYVSGLICYLCPRPLMRVGTFLLRDEPALARRGTAASTDRRAELTDSDVGNARATSGASTTATVSFNREAYGLGFAFDQSSWYSGSMSSGPGSGRLRRVFFILMTFASGRLPGANEANPVGTVSKHHQQQPVLIRMPHHDRTILA